MTEFRHAGAIELYDAHALIQRADYEEIRREGYETEAFWPRGLSAWPERRICKVIEILAEAGPALLEMQITFRDRDGETWGHDYTYRGSYAIQWAEEPYEEEEDGNTSQRSVVPCPPGSHDAPGQHGAVAPARKAA